MANPTMKFCSEVVLSVFQNEYGPCHYVAALDCRFLCSPLELECGQYLDSRHLGTHFSWLTAVYTSTRFSQFIYDVFYKLWDLMYKSSEGGVQREVLLIMCDATGVHRSLAASYLTAIALEAFPGEYELITVMPVRVSTTGAPDDHCHCVGSDGTRPCDLCRIEHFRSPPIRIPVSAMACKEGQRAMADAEAAFLAFR